MWGLCTSVSNSQRFLLSSAKNQAIYLCFNEHKWTLCLTLNLATNHTWINVNVDKQTPITQNRLCKSPLSSLKTLTSFVSPEPIFYFGQVCIPQTAVPKTPRKHTYFIWALAVLPFIVWQYHPCGNCFLGSWPVCKQQGPWRAKKSVQVLVERPDLQFLTFRSHEQESSTWWSGANGELRDYLSGPNLWELWTS